MGNFGTNNLKKIRIARGLNQDVPASVLKTTRQRYARMENGHADISLADLEKLAQYYNVPIAELTGHADSEVSAFEQLSLEYEQKTGKKPEALTALYRGLKEQESIWLKASGPAGPAKDSKTGTAETSGRERQSGGEIRYGIKKPPEVFVYPLENGIRGIRTEDFPCKDESAILLDSTVNSHEKQLIRCILEILQESGYPGGKESDREGNFCICLSEEDEMRLMSDDALMRSVRRKLIPAGGLYKKIDDWFGVSPEELRIIQTASLAEDYHVPAAYMIETLKEYSFIGTEQEKRLKKGLRYYTEERLRAMIGIASVHEYPAGEDKKLIPACYIDHILMNFEKGYIPFVTFQKAMELCGISVDSLRGLRKPMDDKDDWDDWE